MTAQYQDCTTTVVEDRIMQACEDDAPTALGPPRPARVAFTALVLVLATLANQH